MTQQTRKVGYCYLHTNGELIFKSPHCEPRDFDESDFVRKWWRYDNSDRGTAWTIILETIGLQGVTPRVKDLAVKWGLDYQDLRRMLGRMTPTPLMSDGLPKFMEGVLGMAPDDCWKKLKEDGTA